MRNLTSFINWSRREQVALGIAVVVGAALGIVLGYLVYAIGSGADGALPFSYWLESPIRSAAIWWALFGAAIAVALIYIRRFLSQKT